MGGAIPVNPNASNSARQLLADLYSWKGTITLSGQHNQMYHMSEPTDHVASLVGRKPSIWGGEWGFSDQRHAVDDIALRPKLVEEVRKHHDEGAIIVITYHQASPTVGEPCDFMGGVIVDLSDQEWDDVLTPGSALYSIWADHVDRLGEALLTFSQDGIPVIFRPYHEMNGSWFWWGGDSERFIALWKQLFHRFAGIDNLLWAWNPDKPLKGVGSFFPGSEWVDLLGTDIYPMREATEVYPTEWIKRMRRLAGEKPLALSEFSVLPTEAQLESYPWSYVMAWDNMLFHANSDDAIRSFYASDRVR